MLNEKLLEVAFGDTKRLMVFMPPRHGKALEVNTPVPTPDGWRSIGLLCPGDWVFDESGRATEVLAVSPVWRDRPVYRVTTDSGQSVIADAAHEWPVRLCRKRPDAIRRWETQRLAARQCDRKPLLRRTKSLTLPDANLPIDPYTLGVWLGDGSQSGAIISAAPADAVHLRERIGRCYRTTDQARPQAFGILGLFVQLRAIGALNDKHVPAAYLRASQEQRLALLQGLIDTDGHVAPKGQVEFCNASKRLAEAVRELVVSLGYKASLCTGRATLYGKDCGAKYRVMFYMPDAASMPRKRSLCIAPTKQPGHYLSFEDAGTADTVCIEVASDSHLFLVGEGMLPTCNSQMISRYFPAWYLSNFPDKRVILTSYEATFAASWGRHVRNTLAEAKRTGFTPVELAADSKAAASWNIEGHEGGMHTAGVGGAITGYGGDLLIIDDPVKSSAEAYSVTYRERAKEWYGSTFYSRAEPGAAIVIVATRWHQDDLPGWVLSNSGEQWEVISLPAIAEDDDQLGRAPGQALWPARYDEDALAAIKREQGSYWWAALYQQRPAPREGGMFKRHWFEIVQAMPHDIIGECRYWDKAATEGGGDWTVGVRIAETSTGQFIVRDVQRDQLGPQGVRSLIKQTALLDGYNVRQAMEQEPGSAGKDVAVEFAAILAGSPFECSPATGPKGLRAESFAAQAQAGNVKLLQGPWNADFIEELAAFNPGAEGVDDQVDAASGAFNSLARGVEVEEIVLIDQIIPGFASRRLGAARG